ncbi:thiamine phosphate synthase [Chitinophaga horti]|uniref:Thiamine-phosphate synthase n=1 Tax=Chitinophaga horti TaxID=2920382 RepID=A0ABY6IZE6_9BACT|nr:thiamine phosphate synthase [Chitinophaga horti]UYQ92766.1 thiamine phosphate synthase [Chitinophaga horti]
MIQQLLYISQAPHVENIRLACEAGCRFIQLRVKNESPEAWLRLAVEAKAVCDFYEAALFINDNPGIALKVQAAGVHLGLNDLSVADARKILGPRFIIGGTANEAAHIRKHEAEGADYIGLGPFRFTTTKEKLSPVLGLDGYRRVLAEAASPLPVLAIGGILREDIDGLLNAGLHGIAVSGLITHAEDRKALVTGILHQLKTFADGTVSYSR